jgi:hypothetical protein
VILGLLLVIGGIGGIILSEDDMLDNTVDAPNTFANRVPLFAGTTVGQTFRAPREHLSAIGLHLGPYTQRQPTGRVILHLRSLTIGPDLRRSVVPAEAARSDSEVRFLFPPIADSRGVTYMLTLEYPDGGPDKALGVQFAQPDNSEGQAYDDGERYVDGTPAGGDLAFSLFHRERPLAAVQFFFGIVALGVAGLAAAMRVPHTTPRGRATAVLLTALPFLAALPFLRNIAAVGVEHWNPLPPVAGLSPHHLFQWAFSLVVGTKVSSAIHLAIGVWGTFFFLRSLGRSRLGSFVGAGIFLFSSFFSLHIAHGDLDVLGLAFLPWVLFFLSQTPIRWQETAGAGLALGLVGLSGSLFSFLEATVVALAMGGLNSRSDSSGRGRKRTFMALLIAIAVLSLRFIGPSVDEHRALSEPPETTVAAPISARFLIDVFSDPNQKVFVEKFPGQRLPWSEYGAYVGLFPILLAAFGAVRSPRRVGVFLLLAMLFAGVAFMPIVQNVLLQTVPSIVVIPSRAVGIVVLFIGILAAFGFDALRRALNDTERADIGAVALTAAFALFALFIISDLLFVSSSTATTFLTEPSRVPALNIGRATSAIVALAAAALWTLSRMRGTLRRPLA